MTNNVVADEIRILSPTAILGHGLPKSSFQAGLARKPHLIAVDAGPSAPGRCVLGAGVSFTNRQAVQRDLRHMLVAGRLGIPVVTGTGRPEGASARDLDFLVGPSHRSRCRRWPACCSKEGGSVHRGHRRRDVYVQRDSRRAVPKGGHR